MNKTLISIEGPQNREIESKMTIEKKIDNNANNIHKTDDVDIQATEINDLKLDKKQPSYMFGKMSGAPWVKKESNFKKIHLTNNLNLLNSYNLESFRESHEQQLQSL